MLDITPQAIGLNGNLAVSFGSRGNGNADAHYEPDMRIINITKTKGLGALAHEYFHALDHYFAGFEYTMKGMKAATKQDFAPETRTEVKDAFKNLYEVLRASDLKKRSQTLDSQKNKDYFSQMHEMAARSFENYVLNKLNASGHINDFLSNYTPEADWNGNPEWYPYPTGEEAIKINEAFDGIFNVLETKTDGNSVSLQEPTPPYNAKEYKTQEGEKIGRAHV